MTKISVELSLEPLRNLTSFSSILELLKLREQKEKKRKENLKEDKKFGQNVISGKISPL